jgi:hypothetical protein
VRNELNGARKLHDSKEVILSSPLREPFMPRPFPLGKWKITKVYKSNNPNYQPVIFETDAHQLLPIWALDKNGGYDHETEELTDDYGYWLHHAWVKRDGVYVNSATTQGCGNIININEAIALEKILKAGDTIEVV